MNLTNIYAIDDMHGNFIRGGFSDYESAWRAAQQLADERQQCVCLYTKGTDSDFEAETIAPTTA